MTTKEIKKPGEDQEAKRAMEELLEYFSTEIGIQIDDPESKSKTSFYITRLTQVLLKRLADTYGISQGDIIGWTPLIVANLAERSLERRKRSVATLKTLDDQIQSSIEAMKSVAPHLSGLLDYPANMISQLVDLEEKAVENKVISGLGVKKDGVESNVDFPLYMIFISEPFESEAAYQRDLDELRGGAEVATLFRNLLCKNLSEKEAGNEHKDDTPRTDSK
jgi:hypothetical protein